MLCNASLFVENNFLQTSTLPLPYYTISLSYIRNPSSTTNFKIGTENDLRSNSF